MAKGTRAYTAIGLPRRLVRVPVAEVPYRADGGGEFLVWCEAQSNVTVRPSNNQAGETFAFENVVGILTVGEYGREEIPLLVREVTALARNDGTAAPVEFIAVYL